MKKKKIQRGFPRQQIDYHGQNKIPKIKKKKRYKSFKKSDPQKKMRQSFLFY